MFLHSFLKFTFTIFLQHFHKKSFVIKIDTDFNLNILLKLFFLSLILANNNLPLKIYYENIMIAFPSFFPFFPSFFLLHTCTTFPSFSLFFPLFLSPSHMYLYSFLFFFFLLSSFFPNHFLQTPEHSTELSFFLFLFVFSFFLSPLSLSTSSVTPTHFFFSKFNHSQTR